MKTIKEKQFSEDYFDYNLDEALYLTYSELEKQIEVFEAELALDFDKQYNKDLKNCISFYKKQIKKRLSLTEDNYEGYLDKCFMVIYEDEEDYDYDAYTETYIKVKSVVGHPFRGSKKVLWSFVCEHITYSNSYDEITYSMDSHKEVEFYNMIEITNDEYNRFKNEIISRFTGEEDED